MKTEEDSFEEDSELIPLIEGKVADILKFDDQYVIVINKGREDGVTTGMDFVVYERGKEIRDPDSNVSLGFLESIKANVKIIQVSEKHSIAQSNETETIVIDQMGSLIPTIFGKKTTIVPKTLPVDTSANIDEINRKQIIQIGDLVKEIYY